MQLSPSEMHALAEYFVDKPVLKAFVFGSTSRDTASADSDLDILIELDYSRHIGLGFIEMKLDLEEKLHKKIDLVSSNSVSSHILPFIDRDKQLIYERKNG